MRFPPRTILMPFAFSDPSFSAWSFTRALAERFKASVIALHVYEWVMPSADLPPLPLSPEEKRAMKKRLGQAVGPDITLRFSEGGVVRELLKAAEETKADLIVMATEGRTGLKRLARDSVTEEVVRASRVPVLTVHGYAAVPGTVLAPVNAQEYSLAGLEAAERWATALNAPLTVLNVREKAEPKSAAETRAMLRDRVGRSSAWARLKLEEGDPVKTILQEGQAHGLIVMVAHRKGLLRDAVLGTTAEQVLRRSPVPVLTIPGTVKPEAARPRRLRGGARRRAAAGRRRKPLLRRTIL